MPRRRMTNKQAVKDLMSFYTEFVLQNSEFVAYEGFDGLKEIELNPSELEKEYQEAFSEDVNITEKG